MSFQLAEQRQPRAYLALIVVSGSGDGLPGDGRRPLVLDEPVVVAPVRVPRDVVEHDELLELVQEIDGGLLGQRIRLESPQVHVGVLYKVHQSSLIGFQINLAQLIQWDWIKSA